MRLDKFLSELQIASRKQTTEMIRDQRLTCNQVLVKTSKQQIDPNQDQIRLDNNLIKYQPLWYWLLNKPAGVISATADKQTKTVLDLLSDQDKRTDLFPVGRLDKDTTGLLLLTNDGKLAHQLLSPRHHVAKTYLATVSGELLPESIEKFASGLRIDAIFTAQPAKLEILSQATGTAQTRVTIHEGKFHQVKRMFQAVGCTVVSLQRIAMGTLKLDPELKLGQYRQLTQLEVAQLSELKKFK